MAIIKNEIDKTLQAYSPSRLTVTAVTISSLSSSFLKAKNTSTISPSQIELTASIVGFTTPTYTWYYSTSTNLSTWIAISTGISLAVTNTLYNTHITSSTGNTFIRYKVVASQTGWTTTETYFDINYNEEKNDVPVLTFTKDSIALPTTSADTCTYTGAFTDISVSIAGTALSYATTGNSTFNVTVGTLSGTGVVTASTAGNVQTYTISGMNGTGLTATLNIPFTITARDARGTVTTFTKNIFVSKVTSGTAGVPGPSGDTAIFAYYVISSASLPASPTITQNATPAFGAVASYNTWYLQPKATLASSDWQFQISGTKSAAGTYTWESSLTGYLSTFKVGVLSALSADLGVINAGSISGVTINVSKTIKVATAAYNPANTDYSAAELGINKSFYNGANIGGYAYGVDASGGKYGGYFVCDGSYTATNTGVYGQATGTSSGGNNGVGVFGIGTLYGVRGTGNTGGGYFYASGISTTCATPSYGLLTDGQIRSTASVVAPISVNSTVLCTNLNANYLQGNLASAFFTNTAFSTHTTAADHDARYPHYWPCDSGAAYASNGMNFRTLGIAGVQTRGTGNTLYTEAISDRRLKQDIEPEVLGLEFINKLNPVSYRLIKDPVIKYHGFIAQDLGIIISSDKDALYQTHNNGTLGVDYMSIIAPLVKAVQELTLRIKILENK